MLTVYRKASGCALLAAVLYALNTPLDKLLLDEIPAVILAGLLYLGAGLGMVAVFLILRFVGRSDKEEPLTAKNFPYVLAMILLDIAAPICLLGGLSRTTAENVSLLNNFELVSTALFAFILFREKITKRLWLGVMLVSAAGFLLSFESGKCLSFSTGSLLVLLAASFWGLENNCTRKLSEKDPLQIVMVKGLCSGTGSLLIGFFLGQRLPPLHYAVLALVVGFVAYGLSIYFYVYAQRKLGAAKTSTYYAISPFIGAVLALLLFRELPPPLFVLAAFIMAVGTYFAVTDHQE